MKKITNKGLVSRMTRLNAIGALAKQGALFVLNHSGGKDSQAMYALVRSVVPSRQILVLHADLGEVEWGGVQDHIRATITPTHRKGMIIAHAVTDFFGMSLTPKPQHGYSRGMWPSPQFRPCTAGLKRGPIEREIRAFLKRNPTKFRTKGAPGGLVVNCMGIRAEESPKRKKAPVLKFVKSNSVAGREWYNWLPIHKHTIGEVWETIALAGQNRHFAYDLGMTRLSCVFCIMSSKGDMKTAAKHNPDLYNRYVATERFMGHTFTMPTKKGPRYLDEIIGQEVDEVAVAKEIARLEVLEEIRLSA